MLRLCGNGTTASFSRSVYVFPLESTWTFGEVLLAPGEREVGKVRVDLRYPVPQWYRYE